MQKLLPLVLAASLSGCLVVADDGPDRHYISHPEPQPLPEPPPGPPVYHLDCGWLANWNCWDVAVAEAEACAPQTYSGRYGGVFYDHGYSCYYPDGSAVFFEEPVTEPLSAWHHWSFSMEDPAGNTCGWFVETDTSISIGTASGTVDMVVDAGGISVICQDGTEWFNRDPYALSYCAGAEWDVPGYWREEGDWSSSFGLLGGNQPVLWSCGW
ncbi:hypothetical protein [Vulgatibacter sp.]|uniref:hypothetical protein n=1 Tax=Vulgatibacter sp. TaxID=1971226 RepID=UPI0035653E71